MIAALPSAAALLLAAPRPASLAASPARLMLVGTESRTIRVTNSGGGVAFVDVAPAGFALDLRGRPKVVPSASGRLEVQPRYLTLRPGEASTLTISAALPARAHAGDRPALVLLTTRPRPGAGLGVRLQIGIVVIVRVPGVVSHRLALRRLRVRHARGGYLLDLSVWNRGNVTERLGPDRVRVSLRRRGRLVARLRVAPRELFPGSQAIESFRYRGRLRGPATVLVEIGAPASGVPILRRSYRIRL